MKIENAIRQLRRALMILLRPSGSYWTAVKSLKPLSSKFGYDRGTPIDRFWIESFLELNTKRIKGKCLEVTDSTYAEKFGGQKITSIDVLDINRKNRQANIHDDLRHLRSIKSNTYDCIILTHVLGLIDDFDSAIKQCHRVLKPGGALLATSSCFSPTYDTSVNFWRFTKAGYGYAFGKYFSPKHLTVTTYGNVLSGQCFWVGMAQEELTKQQLEYNDPRYPCIVTALAIK